MRIHLRIWLAMGAALVVSRASAEDVTTEGTTSPGEMVLSLAGDATTTEGTSSPSPQESPHSSKYARTLNGHIFQPTLLLTGPFATTSFGMSTRAGFGEAQAPRYDLSGNQIGTREYDLAAYGQTLDFQGRIFPDVSLRIEIGGLFFSGINGKGILVVGATAQYGATVGLTAGRNLSRTTRLSFVGDFGAQPQISVLVGAAVLHAIQTRIFDDSGLFSNVRRLRGSPGVSFAWAPSPAFGLVAEARYIWSHRVASANFDTASVNANGLSLAGLLALDLEPLIRWPIGFQAGYRGDIPISSKGIPEMNQATLGIYYTRQVRLALGAELGWHGGDVRPGVAPRLKSNLGTATIWFRYYW